MERLTYRDSKGKAWAELDAFADAEMQMKFGRVALNRLTSYEDTGLMPDEISHFVSVNERLPKADGTYIVYAPSYNGGSSSGLDCIGGIMFCRFKHGKWSIEHGYYNRPNCVTHWMPLPQPPKG